MKKRFVAFLLVLIMVLGMLPVSALAAGTGNIKVRVFNPDNGGVWVVGTDTYQKKDSGWQSEVYRIPELSKFIGENSYRVEKVVGNWCYGGDYNVGTNVYWSNNAGTATMTYWVPGYAPGGSGSGEAGEADEDLGGSGSKTLNFTVEYHSNYPNGTDYVKTVKYTVKSYVNIYTLTVKTVNELGFTAPTGYSLRTPNPWNTAANGTGDNVNNMLSVTNNGSYKLYAQWVPAQVAEKVTLTYKNGDAVYKTQDYLKGDEVLVIDCDATKDGYTFKGWDTNEAATTAVYKVNDTFAIQANTTLHAVWEENTPPTNKPAKPGVGNFG